MSEGSPPPPPPTLLPRPASAASLPAQRGRRRQLQPFPLFDTPALTALLVDNGIKPKWATILHQALLHHTPDFTSPDPSSPPPTAAALYPTLLAHLTALSSPPPSTLLPLLLTHTSPLTSTVHSSVTSSDSTTTKLLLSLADAQLIEAVIIRHRGKQLPSPDEEVKEAARSAGRVTLCVSSQVGCQQGCTFCATGTLGLKGHLMAGEVVEQLLHANRLLSQHDSALRVTNVVYMGQGEPLDNYGAVLASIEAFTSPQLFHLSPSKLTVSTVGLSHRMLSLITDAPHVQLALSLHAPTQALRLQLVPSSSAYTLTRLMSALTQYTSALQKRVLIEYILIQQVNADPSHATALVDLLSPLLPHVAVNLIPYNPTLAVAGRGYKAPAVEEVKAFQKEVQAGGIFCTVRQVMGGDVQGACGQLALNTQGRVRVKDIEDYGSAVSSQSRPVRRRVKGVAAVAAAETQLETKSGDGNAVEDNIRHVWPQRVWLAVCTTVLAVVGTGLWCWGWG